jgi:proteasome lid subunit RPN8/RPN11
MAEQKKSKRKFIISEKDWNIMQQYARIAYDKDKNEVSGITCLKKVKHPINKESAWELFEPVILKQENTGTTTELDGDALRDYYIRAAMKHGKDIRFCWWHSHHTMGAFWSSTDINEIKAWENDSWSLALVVNLFHEYKLNVHIWDPVQYSEDVRLEVLRNVPKATVKQLKDYDELCDKPAVVTVGNQPWYQKRQGNLWLNNTNYNCQPLASDDKLAWNKHDSVEPYAELFNEVVEEIDEMMSDYAQGIKDYKEYTEFVNLINGRLKIRNAKMTLKKIKKGQLLEKTATMFPADHIIFEDASTEACYTQAVVAYENVQESQGGWYVNH